MLVVGRKTRLGLWVSAMDQKVGWREFGLLRLAMSGPPAAWVKPRAFSPSNAALSTIHHEPQEGHCSDLDTTRNRGRSSQIDNDLANQRDRGRFAESYIGLRSRQSTSLDDLNSPTQLHDRMSQIDHSLSTRVGDSRLRRLFQWLRHALVGRCKMTHPCLFSPSV
jgi:hypothetical protein